MTTDPTTHTADLLHQHRLRPGSPATCRCSWRPALMLNDTGADRRQHARHQAEVLAAAGALTTPTPVQGEREWTPGDSPFLPPVPESAYPPGAVPIPAPDTNQLDLLVYLLRQYDAVVEVHAHVEMDTDEDRALHARAVETFREAAAPVRAAVSAGGDAPDRDQAPSEAQALRDRLVQVLRESWEEWLYRAHGVSSSCDHQDEAEDMADRVLAAVVDPQAGTP